jgi:hypothetical protein
MAGGIPDENYVADHLIDARIIRPGQPQTKTEMRYPTRASELVHRRLRGPPSPLHDPSVNDFTKRPREGRDNCAFWA